MKKQYLYLTLFIVFLFAGCGGSNVSDLRSLQNIKRGNEYIGVADRQFNENNLESALRNFENALKEFSLIDYSDGKARALKGSARVYIALGKRDEASILLSRLQAMKSILSGELKFMVTLAFTEYYRTFSISDSLTMVTAEWNNFTNPAEKMQLLAYHLIVTSEKASVQSGDLNTAKKLFSSYYVEDPLDLEIDIQAMSLIAYAAAFAEFNMGNLDESEKYFQYSLQYDKAAGNYMQIADNLYYLGIITERQMKYGNSADYFNRAYKIYLLLNEKEKAGLSNAHYLLQKYRISSEKSLLKSELERIADSTQDKELQNKIKAILK